MFLCLSFFHSLFYFVHRSNIYKYFIHFRTIETRIFVFPILLWGRYENTRNEITWGRNIFPRRKSSAVAFRCDKKGKFKFFFIIIIILLGFGSVAFQVYKPIERGDQKLMIENSPLGVLGW